MARRKLTPLQEWRRNYAELTFVIRSAKAVSRGSTGHKWGDFKRTQAQSLAARLRPVARNFMEERAACAQATADQWAADARKRAIKLGHPIPNTTNPADRIAE